ncbi:hypothetical protein TA3x_003131 [Tundrisphaera sp. TA3]|uniref:hypothetical protein n=1 Tax=Tundrisphaera sp. TA3 TaxID=3435775 RepID=UPI003EBA7B40
MNAACILPGRSGRARRRPRPIAIVERLEGRELLAGAGALDPAFGGGRGFVNTPLPGSPAILSNVSMSGLFALPDGKAVAVAVVTTSGLSLASGVTSRLILARYDADGSPDSGFGTGGQVDVAIPFSTVSSRSTFARNQIGRVVAIQPDGKILAAGRLQLGSPFSPDAGSTFAVIRINVDGSLDTTFGSNGLAVYPPGARESPSAGVIEASAMALQPDGRIILVGGSGQSYAAVRLNPEGSLDTGFGVNGTATADPGLYSSPTRVAIQADGGIILAGPADTRPSITDPSFAVIRLAADGRVDTTFGGPAAPGGVVILPGDQGDPRSVLSADVAGLAVQPDGKIVLSTEEIASIGGLPYAQALHRLNADGTPDASFGQAGLLSTTFAGPLGIQADGRIFVGGGVITLASVEGGVTRRAFAAARFNADGSPDASFGDASSPGLARYDLGAAVRSAEVAALAVQSDGNILLAGAAGSADSTSLYSRFAVARALGSATPGRPALPPPPAPPASFDGSGRTNLAVYLPEAGAFAYRPAFGSPGSNDWNIPFGIAGSGKSIPAAADFDGIGVTQLAVYLPSQGAYLIRPGDRGPDRTVPIGLRGAGRSIPTPADYTGDGKADVAVYLPSRGAFLIRPSEGGPDRVVRIGTKGTGRSIPAPADYTGDGRADVAVYLPAKAAFLIRPSEGGPNRLIRIGPKGVGKAIPVPADYTGDGLADVAVYLPAQAAFRIRPSEGGSDQIVAIGVRGPGRSIPVPGNYSGSVRTEPAIYDTQAAAFTYRPASGGPDLIVPFDPSGRGRAIPAAATPATLASIPKKRTARPHPGGPSARAIAMGWHASGDARRPAIP